ncbi:hypothetical protein CDV50_01205 [Haematobacter massiliensis]|uniref:Membrane protein n=2 Tax=Haematobacter massiliensis TaxID=195105 RepID=A0A086Y2W9_9RHOB|nr:membrane protein [Haematobacter massiliensis]OWJ74093.1 hypothetical protein CDV50_01205 [Haematobacter massiliensis]OWJ88554.1 hypothetical protein CDV51_00805 [Haematobacter massiliensis]QBJ26165.1 DUF1345 domain-containing protein [Haematobacter massiliensis]
MIQKALPQMDIMTLPRHPRFIAFFATLAFACGGLGLLIDRSEALILGFDLAAAVFIASCVPLWLEEDEQTFRARKTRDDGGRLFLALTVTVVLLMVLVTLAVLVGGKEDMTAADLVLVTATLAISWLFGNLVYAFHYAHVYYDEESHPALDFPGEEAPLFADFCYFSLVIGMTFQVSDVEITTRRFRRIATLHAMVAFFFNLGVVALTINVVAGVL